MKLSWSNDLTGGSPARKRNIITPDTGIRVSDYDCGIHNITYKDVRPGCPVCKLDREVSDLRRAAHAFKNQLDRVTTERDRLQEHVDIMFAIREAAQMLDDEDMEFLKLVLYQWRDARSIGLKTTHGVKKGRRQRAANGFIAMPRQGEPYGHLCTSIGGVAIAEYFEEATNWMGSAEAMKMLARGMADHLPGVS